MKKIFLSIFFVLVFIASCTKEPNELDRCIETNQLKNNYIEKTQSFSDWMNDNYEGFNINIFSYAAELRILEFFEDNLKDYDEYQIAYKKMWAYTESLNSLEKEVSICTQDKMFDFYVKNYEIPDGQNITELVPYLLKQQGLDKKFNQNLYMKNIKSCSSNIENKHLETVKKICNSQGIY